MDASQLHRLAQALRQLAVSTTNDDSDAPSGAELLVGTDLFTHSPTTVSEVTRRTGVAQSQVSTIVREMREQSILMTTPDPHDRRRTLLSLEPDAARTYGSQRGSRSLRPAVTGYLENAGQPADAADVDAILDLLDALSTRLGLTHTSAEG